MRMTRVGILTALLSLLSGGGPAMADTKAGIAAYQRGDYPRAMTEFDKGASRGEAAALYNLGVAYAEGKAAAQDWSKALLLYEQAARKGDVFAAFNLGQAYRKGQGAGVDHAQAALWYEMAAKRGDYRAANELGLLHVEGKGVPRDPIEGFAWIYPATHAEIMDSSAMANAMQIAGMLTKEQIQIAQTRGQSYYKRYIAPNKAVVRTIQAQ